MGRSFLMQEAIVSATNRDSYGNICDPDLNNDLLVNLFDLSLMTSAMNSTTEPDADLDGDGIVTQADLNILNDYLGMPPGPSCSSQPGGCVSP